MQPVVAQAAQQAETKQPRGVVQQQHVEQPGLGVGQQLPQPGSRLDEAWADVGIDLDDRIPAAIGPLAQELLLTGQLDLLLIVTGCSDVDSRASDGHEASPAAGVGSGVWLAWMRLRTRARMRQISSTGGCCTEAVAVEGGWPLGSELF
jgi:hypothetical protein